MSARASTGDRGRPGSVRIIGGCWRGRRLAVPDEPGLRPTTDRIRETLFNWLQPRIAGSRVADLFAGTGILGLEALSRGAGRVVFVEHNQRLAAAIRDQLQALGADAGEVLADDAYRLLAAPARQRFDLVFLDPPYGQDGLTRLCTLLAHGGWLAEGALVYAEHDRRRPARLPAGYRIYRDKSAGQVRYMLLQYEAPAASGGQQ